MVEEAYTPPRCADGAGDEDGEAEDAFGEFGCEFGGVGEGAAEGEEGKGRVDEGYEAEGGGKGLQPVFEMSAGAGRVGGVEEGAGGVFR